MFWKLFAPQTGFCLKGYIYVSIIYNYIYIIYRERGVITTSFVCAFWTAMDFPGESWIRFVCWNLVLNEQLAYLKLVKYQDQPMMYGDREQFPDDWLGIGGPFRPFEWTWKNRCMFCAAFWLTAIFIPSLSLINQRSTPGDLKTSLWWTGGSARLEKDAKSW